MPSVIFDFHQNVTFLQNLVAEAGRSPRMNDDHHHHHGSSNSSSSNANGHYNIRRCVRHIQSLLAREDFILLPAESSNGGGGEDHGTSASTSTDPQQQAAEASGHEETFHMEEDDDNNNNNDDDDEQKKAYSQVTGDLITLLTMDFEAAGDPSIGQLVRETILPRVIGLLETAPSFTPSQLHLLLHHLLFLLETDSESAGGSEGGNHAQKNTGGVQPQHLSLAELFNRHVTNLEELSSLLLNDEELFVALHIVLRCQEIQYQYQHQHHQHQSSSTILVQAPPPLSLVILINSLIEYWTLHCLTSSSSSSSGGGEERTPTGQHHPKHGHDETDDDSPKDLNTWLQCQFLRQQQQTLYQSPDMLRREVDAYVGNVERYGTHLIESTLRLLEDASANSASPSGTASLAPSAYTTRTTTTTHLIQEDDEEEEDHDVIILKYAILATNFLAAMHKTTFSLMQVGGSSAAFAMSRSLWHEYVNFLVHRLSGGDNHDAMRCDTGESVPMNDASSVFTARPRRSSTEEVHLAVAATDTLWRLAQLHYPIRSTTTINSRNHMSSATTGKNEDIPLITATILRLWKHATHYWDERTEDWIQCQLQYYFPSSTTSSAGKDLRHSLQAIIVSYMCFPNHYGLDTYPKGPVETLMELVLHENNVPAVADPWKGWVFEQLSNDMGHSVATSNSSK